MGGYDEVPISVDLELAGAPVGRRHVHVSVLGSGLRYVRLTRLVLLSLWSMRALIYLASTISTVGLLGCMMR